MIIQGRMQDFFVVLRFLSASVASNSFAERTTFTDGGLGGAVSPPVGVLGGEAPYEIF